MFYNTFFVVIIICVCLHNIIYIKGEIIYDLSDVTSSPPNTPAFLLLISVIADMTLVL